MGNSGKENLRELLAEFMDPGAANRAAEDIEGGEELLRQWPSPQPDEAMLAEVKKRVAAAVRRRRMITPWRRVLAAASVAAAIAVASVVALRSFENQPVKQAAVQYAAMIPSRIWEGSDITTDDADIVVLAAEVEAIENELSGVELNENGGNGAVGDLEMELIEMGGDFWKG